MERCLARRAFSDTSGNRFRLYKETDKGVTEKHYIYMEYRCKNEAAPNSKVCFECTKKIVGYKYQASPLCDHGLIGGPYPTGSDLYNAPDYNKLIKQGWKIRPFDEARAKEAIEKAVSETMPAKKTKPATTETPAEPKKPKRSLKLKAAVAPTEPIVAPKQEDVPLIVESLATPVITSDVITLKIRKQRIQGKEYYICSQNDKVYTVTAGGPGKYVGRFMPAEDCDSNPTINTSYPDSDVE